MTAEPGTARYWDQRYDTIGATNVSWFQAHPTPSRTLITDLGLDRDAPIVGVGGGASTLVDALIGDGFTDVTVVDLSHRALDGAAARIPGPGVTWVQCDVRQWLPTRRYALWRDRAAYHFLFRLLGPLITWMGVRQEQRIWQA